MQVVYIKEDKFQYDIHSLYKAFYPDEDVRVIVGEKGCVPEKETDISPDDGISFIDVNKSKNDLKKYGIIASAAGVALFFILTHFPIKIGSGKKISIADRLFNIIDTMNKGYFILITAAVFVLICALYYVVMWRSYERREA